MTTSDMPFGYTWIEEHLDPIPGFTLTQSSLACRLNRISLSLFLSTLLHATTRSTQRYLQ